LQAAGDGADRALQAEERCMIPANIADGRVVAIQSLSNIQLIQILQHNDVDDELTQMVEEELARRETQGTRQ
jgi:hypothetical protein